MSAERVEYHQGAIADVKSAVAWHQKRSPKAALDFSSGTLAVRKERHQTIPALAIPVCHHLFRTRIRSHNLVRRSRQQATGVLGTSALKPKGPPPTVVTFQTVA
jgi:hypothetical protein